MTYGASGRGVGVTPELIDVVNGWAGRLRPNVNWFHGEGCVEVEIKTSLHWLDARIAFSLFKEKLEAAGFDVHDKSEGPDTYLLVVSWTGPKTSAGNKVTI